MKRHPIALAFRGFLASLCVLTLLTLSASAQADLLRIRLATFGEEPPGRLCIVSDFSTLADSKLEKWSEILGALSNAPSGHSNPSSGPECGGIESPNVSTSLYWSCLDNTSPASERHAVIYVKNAVIISAALDDNIARIEFNAGKNASGRPAYAELLGGHYHRHVPLVFREADGTQLMDLPLVPRCVTRDLLIPEYFCGEQSHEPPALEGVQSPDSDALREQVRSIRAVVNNPRNGNGRVELTHCAHTFRATWVGSVPPRQLELEPRKFHFEWKRVCLAPSDVCPDVQVQGAGRITTPSPKGGVCHYEAEGAPRFPATVQFSFKQDSVTTSWQDTLSTPGLRLFSYIPDEQRRIRLEWNWDVEWDERKDWAADEIDHAELRTPEGRVHAIPIGSRQMRVPELDCDDHVTYRYVGTRSFKERPADVSSDGVVRLEDPSNARADNFLLAGALGAGWRRIGGAGEMTWGPQAEVQAILVWRQLREWLGNRHVAVDGELRIAGIVAGQPYCSRLVRTGESSSCGAGDWQRVPYWRFPFVVGPNIHIGRSYTAGLGVGLSPTSYHHARDARRMNRPLLMAGRVHLGYKVSRAISFEAYVRAFWGEEVRETAFDDAGVQRAGILDGAARWSLFPGLVFRADDIF